MTKKIKWETIYGNHYAKTTIGNIRLSCYSRIQSNGDTKWYACINAVLSTFPCQEIEVNGPMKEAKKAAVMVAYNYLLDYRDGLTKEIETFERLSSE